MEPIEAEQVSPILFHNLEWFHWFYVQNLFLWKSQKRYFGMCTTYVDDILQADTNEYFNRCKYIERRFQGKNPV